jgi:hypothetical protein
MAFYKMYKYIVYIYKYNNTFKAIIIHSYKRCNSIHMVFLGISFVYDSVQFLIYSKMLVKNFRNCIITTINKFFCFFFLIISGIIPRPDSNYFKFIYVKCLNSWKIKKIGKQFNLKWNKMVKNLNWRTG